MLKSHDNQNLNKSVVRGITRGQTINMFDESFRLQHIISDSVEYIITSLGKHFREQDAIGSLLV